MIAATPAVAVSASPARIVLAARASREIRVTNAGHTAATVVVRSAGYALGPRGSPRIRMGRRPGWLRLNPNRLTLSPGASGVVTVVGAPTRTTAPGDHAALVLLRTRPTRGAPVAVGLQIGVVVTLRVPGTIMHRLRVEDVRVELRGRRRFLDVVVSNRGNVTERIGPGRLRVALVGSRRRIELRPSTRELLPRSRGIVLVPCGAALARTLTVEVQLRSLDGGMVVRDFVVTRATPSGARSPGR